MVLLGAEGKVIWSRSLERPRRGGVSSDGHVAVEDWLFGRGRKGSFYVFSPEGKVLIRERFSANLSHSGIAPDASLAWCSTASSETSDSRQLAVFEVDPPSLLFKRDRLYGQPERVMRTPEGLEVHTDCKVGYRLSTEGDILNPAEVERQIEQHKGTGTPPNVPVRSAKDLALG